MIIIVLLCIMITLLSNIEMYKQLPVKNISIQDTFGHRSERIKSICSHSISNEASLTSKTKLISSNLYWLQKSKIVYCPVFKSASSTWLENLISLSGASPKRIKEAKQRHKGSLIHQIQHVGAIQPSEQLWYDYVTQNQSSDLIAFMVVRHPFERLVSAYRDKLERIDQHYYEKYGKKIVYRFRDKAIETLGSSFFNKSNNYGTFLQVENDNRPNANLPSFWEFVQSVIIKLNMDEHWQPMFQFCSVCHPIQLQVNPYILKFENLNEEQVAFIEDVGWRNKIDNTIQLNVNRFAGISSEEITHLYFSNLSDNDIKNLYKVYEYDFLLFHYTFKIRNITLPFSQDDNEI